MKKGKRVPVNSNVVNGNVVSSNVVNGNVVNQRKRRRVGQEVDSPAAVLVLPVNSDLPLVIIGTVKLVLKQF